MDSTVQPPLPVENRSKLLAMAIKKSELDFLAEPRTYTARIELSETGELLGLVKPDEILLWKCQACRRKFASKQSLERHHERFQLCKNWTGGDEAAPIVPVHKWISDLLEKTVSIEDENNDIFCKFCKSRFSNTGNLHKHFNSAIMCNRLAYAAVKEAFRQLDREEQSTKPVDNA